MEQATASPLARDGAPLNNNARREILEIAWGYGLILLVIWTPPPLQRVFWYAAAAVIIVLMALRFEGWKAAGLRWTNFLRASWVMGAAVAVAGAILIAGARFHTLHLPSSFHLVDRYAGYAIWACVQQFLLQAFFLSRMLRVTGKPGLAALTAGVLFAVAHLPNPLLVPLTLIWGLVACAHFLRYRNLIPLAVSHAILGIVLTMTLPGPGAHYMRVGLGYLRVAHDWPPAAAAVSRPLTQPSSVDKLTQP